MHNNNKIQRINEEIQRELANLIREIKDPRLNGVMLSVMRCDTTSDLKFCKVFISILGEYNAKELRKGLKSATGFLRGGLSRTINLRNTPELIFVLDDSIQNSIKINNILEQLNNDASDA
jgi:ribosome-binding factor A